MFFLKLTEIENSTDLCEHPSMPGKMARRPSVISKINSADSEALILSPSQFRRRKQKTVEAVKAIHCGSHIYTSEKEQAKSIKDGLWTTLITSAETGEMREYISNSKKCMGSLVPSIVNSKIKEYKKSQANKIRSMRVLYESGLLGKRKYTSIRNSSDVLNEAGGGKRKNQKAEILPRVEVPKILPYKNLMSFLKTIDVGELRDLQTLATELSTECVPGVYRPLKSYLLKLADLYMDLHKQIPMLHWFHGEEGLFWVAIGADGAPFGKDDCATGKLV